MQSINLRKATISDAPAISRVTLRAFEAYANEVGHREDIGALNENLQDIENDIENKIVYVCDIDGKVTGALRLEMMGEGICYLSRFAVDARWQNLGIGRLMLEKVREVCTKMGTKAVVLYTAGKVNSAVNFYLGNGFSVHSVDKRSGYVRLLMVCELVHMDELFDYESLLP